MNAYATSAKIAATQIPQGEPMEEVLPKHFGKYMLRVEDTIFSFARHLCPQLENAIWRFYELSNGGFYMAPSVRSVTVRIFANAFDRRVSGDAAGITVCLYAFRQLSVEIRDETMTRHYFQLDAFAREHPEAELILAAAR